MMGSNLKRPGGLTVIAILWLIAGLFNVYQSLQSISADVQALPFLSNPELDSWFQFGIPAELAISIFLLVLGFAQIASVYGLWTGKSYAYKLALAISVVLIITNISLAGLYSTAPSEIGLASSATMAWIFVLAGIFWTAIIWRYLSKVHVKAFLGVIPPPSQPVQIQVNTPKLQRVVYETPKAPEPKYYCRYCGVENKKDAVFYESCSKLLKA